MKATILELRAILEKSCPDVVIKSDLEHTYFSEIPMDSMDIAGFILDVEEAFEIKVKNSELQRINTLSKLCDYINQQS